jgi:hypothetical protein
MTAARLPMLFAAAAGLVACEGVAPPDSPVTPQFVDVTEEAGIDFRHVHGARGDYHYPETFGAGAAWVDYDEDGLLDLYLVNSGDVTAGATPEGRNRLYRQTQGRPRFADVTQATGAGDPGYGMGATAADVDADGDVDIFVTNVGANALLVQDEGRFREAARDAGVADVRWGTAAAFLDADLDGDLDLAVVNYVPFDVQATPLCRQGSVRTYCDPKSYAPTQDLLYRNDSDSSGPHFVDVTRAAGFVQVGRGLGLALADADLDGDTDLFVANDGSANHLYRNDSSPHGSIRLAEVGLQAGVRFNAEGRAEAGMGIDVADVDGDGWTDLVVSNFSRETNTLYRHEGAGLAYRDATVPAGLGGPSFRPLGFGIAFVDVDADGDPDLAVANGHVLDKAESVDPSTTYAQSDQLFLNRGGLFSDSSASLGAAHARPRVSRALVPGDYDGDGDEDLLITSSGDAPRLLRNDTEGGRWLVLGLRASAPGNRSGLGARVTVEIRGRRIVRQLHDGGSYLSHRPPLLHVGLGSAIEATVRVDWPGGGAERWHLPAGRHILTQDSGNAL